MSEDGRDKEPAASTWSTLGRFSGHGLTIAGGIGLFMALGWWADGKFGTRPLLTIVGAFLGGAAGFYSMWRDLVAEPRERASRRKP